ncbi:MAG: hypothetical protein U0235_12540 [Polyangiaceae bacterium]
MKTAFHGSTRRLEISRTVATGYAVTPEQEDVTARQGLTVGERVLARDDARHRSADGDVVPGVGDEVDQSSRPGASRSVAPSGAVRPGSRTRTIAGIKSAGSSGIIHFRESTFSVAMADATKWRRWPQGDVNPNRAIARGRTAPRVVVAGAPSGGAPDPK